MSKKSTLVRRRPDGLTIQDAIKQNGDEKGRPKSYRKSAISMKAVEGGDFADFGTMAPNEQQVETINSFTRSPKTAEELVVFPTMSCNDLYDRDDEAFKGPEGTSTIQQFASLEPPFSFVGKSFMMDHDYTVSKGIGRIFDEEVVTETIDGQNVEFLKHWIYMPNTAQFAPIIEKIDFGVQWAVSVGVVIDGTQCTVCDSPMYAGSWLSFCYENGHEKGLWYDPNSDEKDGWGWAMPVPEGTDGAKKCQMNMYNPRDGYELSSVFLGAQYFAELAKDPSFKGVMKAASAKGVPILGLGRKEAEALPIPHEPKTVQEARAKYTVTVDEDGDPTWTDDEGLKWVYVTDSDEVLSLGKEVEDGSTTDGEVLRSDGDEDPGSEDAAAEGEVGGLEDGEPGGSAAGGGEDVVEGGDPSEGLITESADDEETSEEDDEEEEDEESTTPPVQDGAFRQDMVSIIRSAGLPASIVEQVEVTRDAAETLRVFVTSTATHIKGLERRAEVGDEYLRTLRAEAIDWYTKAHITPDSKGVDTTTYQKVLDRIGDDVEILKELIIEQRDMARAKFPQAVRRSTFETNHNEATPVVDVAELIQEDGAKGDQTVRQIHR